jgi:hypothetical protein
MKFQHTTKNEQNISISPSGTLNNFTRYALPKHVPSRTFSHEKDKIYGFHYLYPRTAFQNVNTLNATPYNINGISVRCKHWKSGRNGEYDYGDSGNYKYISVHKAGKWSG